MFDDTGWFFTASKDGENTGCSWEDFMEYHEYIHQLRKKVMAAWRTCDFKKET